MDISQLRQQHEDISRTAGQLARAIATQNGPQGVGAIRWQLARQLIAHLALEDRILYPSLHRDGSSQVRATALMLQEDTGALAEQFSRYMAAWSDDRVAREWPAFCGATRLILQTLTERVDREERTLYPLAEALKSDGGRIARTG